MPLWQVESKGARIAHRQAAMSSGEPNRHTGETATNKEDTNAIRDADDPQRHLGELDAEPGGGGGDEPLQPTAHRRRRAAVAGRSAPHLKGRSDLVRRGG